jgi:hypothetical protein
VAALRAVHRRDRQLRFGRGPADLEHSNPAVRFRFALVELDVFRRYVQLVLMPVGLTIFHAIDPIESLASPRALGGLATALLFVFVIWKLRRQDVVSFGLAWFALLLVPSAVLVVLDRGEPMSEGRLYTACVGFFLAAGAVAAALSDRARRVSLLTQRRTRDLGFAIIALLSIETVYRNVVWHRAVSLWLEATEYAPLHWLPGWRLARRFTKKDGTTRRLRCIARR